ncbi:MULTISPECIES: polyphenol oxidase family protein [unclassified Arthrobacter]|uniref:polyphenol oxidase family protein n=1 Tax=unclassified Arthrobacter TaxID=235627 RepID=UPI0009E7DDD7|nr:polyphenol oxidase family protein [Arthrobacter sp. Leaf234]
MDRTVDPGRTSPFHWNEEVRPGLRVAFTAVGAGNLALHVGDDPDAVRQSRRRLEAALGVRPDTLRFMSQTHSDRVALLGASDSAERVPPDADAMVSATGSEPLAVLVADCVPIVLADADPDDGGTGATAVVHAGRAGVANGIVVKAVEELRRRGAATITAWIGPSVCGSCYEVPDAMMTELAREIPVAASRTPAGTAALDLPAAVRHQLAQGGVTVEELRGAAPSCTQENTALFSHRREPGAGRLAGLVWRP